MQKSVVLAAVVLAGAISLPEQSLAAPGGRGAMPAFRAPIMMRHAARPFVGHRPFARPHAFRHPTTRPYGTINPTTPYGTVKPATPYATVTPYGTVAHAHALGTAAPLFRPPLVRLHHRVHHKGWHFPLTYDGAAAGYIGMPYDPAEIIPVYGPPPSVEEIPADAPHAAPMMAPRVSGTRDENADACRSERVTVPSADGERAITVVRC